MDNQQTFVTWLDGQFTKSDDGGGAMTLRAGIFDNQSNAVDEWELDHRVYDCCRTSAAMTSDGPIVAFRDRSEEEIRDISMVRYVDSMWAKPAAVHNDNWKMAGCPVYGPAITATGEQVAVAWFTMSDNLPQINWRSLRTQVKHSQHQR